MEEIRVNRLPLLTYRYLHTNDTPLSFEPPKGAGSFTFSDMTCVREGGSLPENFDGASKETVLTAEKGSHYTITIPEGKSQHLVIHVQPTADAAAAFLFRLEKGASLSLTWKLTGGDREGTCVLAAYYDLAEEAKLHVSRLKAVSPRLSSMTSATAYSPLMPAPTSMRRARRREDHRSQLWEAFRRSF